MTPNTIAIELTKGQTAIVDAIDADLAELKWCARFDKHINGFYAVRAKPRVNGKGGTEYMHRTILSRILGRALLKSEHVDHVESRSTLDNRRSNLRLATRAQNQQNQGLDVTNTSGYKGIYWHQHNKSWKASIRQNGKRISLGYFATPEEAARAYDKAAKELHGEFAYLNFPEAQS